MKFLLFTTLLLTIYTTICFGQSANTTRSNALSFELGKTGLMYNLSFDHRFSTGKAGVHCMAGSNFAQYLNAFFVGGGGYGLIGKTKHFLELGADIGYLSVDEVSDDQKRLTLIYPDYTVKTIYPSLNIGYRSYGKYTLFRVGVSPGYLRNTIIPGGYISYGVRF